MSHWGKYVGTGDAHMVIKPRCVVIVACSSTSTLVGIRGPLDPDLESTTALNLKPSTSSSLWLMAPVKLVLFLLKRRKAFFKRCTDPVLPSVFLFLTQRTCFLYWHHYFFIIFEIISEMNIQYRKVILCFFIENIMKSWKKVCVCETEREREKESTTCKYMPVIRPFQPFCCFPGVSHPFPKRPCGECPSWGILLGYETPGVDAGQGELAPRQHWHRALPRMGMPEACHTPAENLPGN